MTNLSILTLNKKDITDFAYERNELLKKAKTDWVLFLDSDEKLSKEIQIEKLSNKYDGYYIYRKNYFLNQYIGQDKIIRLGKKNSGRWERKVHETWNIKNAGLLDSFIIHNTADNLTDYLNKINNYSNLHAQANLEEGKKSTLFKIIFFPIGKFIMTLVKSKHLVFSIMQSLHSFLSWTKMYFRTEQN